MNNYEAIDGQSLLDVCLNTYGSLESLIELVQDNNLQTVNDVVNSGENFVFTLAPNTALRPPIYSTSIPVMTAIQTYYIIDSMSDRLTDGTDVLIF